MLTILQFGPVYTHWGLCGLRPFSTLYLRSWVRFGSAPKSGEVARRASRYRCIQPSVHYTGVAEIFYVRRTESEFQSVLWMFDDHTLVVQTTKMAWLGKIVCSPPTCQFFFTDIFVTILIVCTYRECISVLSVHLCFSKLVSVFTHDWFCRLKMHFLAEIYFLSKQKSFLSFFIWREREKCLGENQPIRRAWGVLDGSNRQHQLITKHWLMVIYIKLFEKYESWFLRNMIFFLEIGKWEPSWKFLHSMSAMNHAHKSKLPETRPNLVFPTHWDTNCIKSQWEKKYTSILA